MKKQSERNNPLFSVALFSVLLGGFVLLFHFIPVPFKATGKEPWVQRLRNPEAFVSAESSSAVPDSLPGASQLALGQKIDLNRAGVSDLAVLPGIGQKMAEDIVRDREQRGPFQRVEDLMRIKGIKEKKFSQIRDYIKVEKR